MCCCDVGYCLVIVLQCLSFAVLSSLPFLLLSIIMLQWYCAPVLWICRAMVLQCYSATVLLGCSAMVLKCYGSAVL